MSDKLEGLESLIRRELLRAVLERSQDLDLLSMMPGVTEAQEKRFDDVEEMLNIPYINREEVPLAMDVFKPVNPEGRDLPAIVTIHGGGFTMGDRRISRPSAACWRTRATSCSRWSTAWLPA